MCGIACAIDWADAEATVRRMVAGIVNRGDITDPVASPRPDTAMCTRRLRIVDAEHAQQPILSGDGRVLVSFNGEIYNHAELRREMTALGVRFHTESDTEVLASALSLWGAAALPRLNGMFAFVALDLWKGDFLAARDPLGVKPLYVIQSDAGYLFCSEIKPLLEATETGDVLLIPPGYLLTKKHCLPFKTPFSSPSIEGQGSPEKLDRLLAQAVHIRVPDLPFALTFSGGIDSTLVTHYARQVRPDAPAYFLGGPSAPDYEFAARYADMTALDLRTVALPDSVADPTDLIREIVETVETFEPSVVTGGLCNYLMAKTIHEDGFKVILCGEGADELFAGYLPHEVTFQASAPLGLNLRAQSLSNMNRDNLQRLDRCNMRFQIEAREPFLDPSIIRYALDCDPTELVKRVDGEPRGKMPLRYLYDLYPTQLPTAIRDRRKTPFGEGAGFEISQTESPWRRYADETISEVDFLLGKLRFADFSIKTKEELLYLTILSEKIDVARAPHLRGRTLLRVSYFEGVQKLQRYFA
jgi:asparagine synthase (glutamine-hydrolysing)